MSLNFVTYLSSIPSSDVASKVEATIKLNPLSPVAYKEYAEFIESDKFNMINMLYASIRRIHPEARVTLIIDKGVVVDQLEDGISVFEYDRQSDFLIIERIHAFRKFFEAHASENLEVVFLDWDCLLLKEMATIFLADFDLFFTIRDRPQMPINAGVMGLKYDGKNREVLLGFFERFVKLISLQKEKYRHWLGDQLVLGYLYFHQGFLPKASHTYEYSGDGMKERVLFLDGDRYNFSPDRGRHYKDKVLLHFKGIYKKSCIQEYWETYLKGRPI